MQLDGLCVSTSCSEYSIEEVTKQLKLQGWGAAPALKGTIPAKTFKHKFQEALEDPLVIFTQARGGEFSLVAQQEACDGRALHLYRLSCD